MKRVFTSLFIFIFSTAIIWGQCQSPPSFPSPGTCMGNARNNDNINNGQTKCFSGNATFNNLNINGGTLIVTGDLRVQNINLNGGNIFIAAGGRFVIEGNASNFLYFNGNVRIINEGFFRSNRSIRMQNANNYIFNSEITSELDMSRNNVVLEINSNASYLVNNGDASIYFLRLQAQATAGAVCLGSGSATNLTSMRNNSNNPVHSYATACMYIQNNPYFNTSLSGSNSLVVVRPGSTGYSGPGSYGAAVVIGNSVPCNVVMLGVDFQDFAVYNNDGVPRLKLKARGDVSSANVHIERSENGLDWEVIATESTDALQTDEYNMTYDDHGVDNGQLYYRIQWLSADGTLSYSSIETVYVKEHTTDMVFYPNPVQDILTIETKDAKQTAVRVFNLMGTEVTNMLTVSTTSDAITLNMVNLHAGSYFIQIGGRTRTILKQ